MPQQPAQPTPAGSTPAQPEQPAGPIPSAHPRAAVLQAILVTVLWSSSWVLITIGLEDIPPLRFAGLRYGLAALLLLIACAARARTRAAVRALTRRDWRDLALLGVVMYAITQGAQFVALGLLPAASVSLALSMTPILVAGIAALTIAEPVGRPVAVGLVIALAGSLTYILAGGGIGGTLAGGLVALLGTVANAAAAILGRAVNRRTGSSPLVVTAVSMSIGAALLLAVGIPVQGMPALSGTSWAIIGWLAVVNTAFAFTLWNHVQRTLSAAVTATINNTMLVQIAVLAWVFLDQPLNLWQIVGVVVVTIGTYLVQRPRAKQRVARAATVSADRDPAR